MAQSIYTGKLLKRSWNEIKDRVASLNPELYQVLEAIPQIDKQIFYLAEYAYGSPIVKNGVLNVPDMSGQVVPISHHNINRDIQEQLSYRSIPVTMLLTNTAEVFIEDQSAVMPLRLFEAGESFGLFEIFNDEGASSVSSTTNVCAGARSLFMLPKISNSLLFKKLNQDYKYPIPVPRGKLSHWHTFSSIASAEGGVSNWSCELLFFPKKLIENLLQPKAEHLSLAYYFLKHAWKESAYLRSQPFYNSLWKEFAASINARHLKPQAKSVDMAKHLLIISRGDIPGFRPSGLGERCGPIKLLHQVMVEKYGLKHYVPTIMQPHHLNMKDKKPVYYGLGLPTRIDVSVKNKQPRSVISDSLEIRMLFDTLERGLENTSEQIVSLLLSVKKTFFHEEGVDDHIFPSKLLPEEDKDFVLCYGDMHNREFSDRNTFTRGCVRLSIVK